MKGNNIFNTWFREFCTLVFIQTIQAFIFAIILVLVIGVMTPSNINGLDRHDVVAATGMVAVIALASVSKIEELVKKIFGIKSGVTDPSMRGGMKSLATTMMAAKLASKVGDNFKKIGGGFTGLLGANKDMRLTKARFARDMKKFGNSPNDALGSGDSGGVNAPMPAGSHVPLSGGSTFSSGPVAQLGGAPAGGAVSNNQSNSKNMDDYYKKVDEYQDRIRELKKKRRDAVFSGISGISETAGAAVFGTMGAIGGSAIGEGKEIITGGLAGMGVGDVIGSLPTKPIKGLDDAITSVASARRAKQQFVNEVSRTSSEAKKAIDNKRKSLTRYSAAKKEFTEFEQRIFDAGDLD